MPHNRIVENTHRRVHMGERALAEAQDAAFYLLVSHWVLTLLLGELCLVLILAVTGQGPGRLSGAASAIALTLLAAASVALFVVSVIFGVAFYRLRTLVVRRQQHDTCVTIVTFALLAPPHGTWFGLGARRKLLRPEVRALFPQP
jgi:hypothetical protein